MALSAMVGEGLGLAPILHYTMGVFAAHLQAGVPMVDRPGRGRAVADLADDPIGGFGPSNGALPLYHATWAAVATLGAGTLPMTWTCAVNDLFDLHTAR